MLIWIILTELQFSDGPLVDPLFLSSPRNTLRALFDGFVRSATLRWDLLYTLGRALGGFLIATILGVPLGLFVGGVSRANKILGSLIDGLRSMPATALFPVFLLVFGAGEKSKIAVATFVCLWAMVIYTAAGVRISGETRRFLLKLHNVSRSQFFVDGLFYPALPSILGGMQTTLSLSLVVTIGAEMLIGTSIGLGQTIYISQSTYVIPTMYAAIALAACAGMVLNTILRKLIPVIIYWERDISPN